MSIITLKHFMPWKSWKLVLYDVRFKFYYLSITLIFPDMNTNVKSNWIYWNMLLSYMSHYTLKTEQKNGLVFFVNDQMFLVEFRRDAVILLCGFSICKCCVSYKSRQRKSPHSV